MGLVVFPDRHPRHPNHTLLTAINRELKDGRILGFICESVGTLEAIKPETRARYLSTRKMGSHARMETTGTCTSLTITLKTDHSLHPGLHEKLTPTLQEARAIGMRLLPVPCLSSLPLPRAFLDDPDFYEPLAFSSADYAERFSDVSRAIQARGVGVAVIAALCERIQRRPSVTTRSSVLGLQLLDYAHDRRERMEIARAVAEWADADLIACHVSCANDYLCTDDKGRSAGGPSVFDCSNRNWLHTEYGVEFVTTPELAAKLVR